MFHQSAQGNDPNQPKIAKLTSHQAPSLHRATCHHAEAQESPPENNRPAYNTMANAEQVAAIEHTKPDASLLALLNQLEYDAGEIESEIVGLCQRLRRMQYVIHSLKSRNN